MEKQYLIRFICKVILFASATLVILSGTIIAINKYINNYIPPQNKLFNHEKVDTLIIGSSHAKTFSACKNGNRIVDKILNQKIKILSIDGGGVKNLQIYLNLFYKKGGEAKKVIYLLDPFALSSEMFEEKHDIFTELDLNLNNLMLLFKENVGFLNIKNYIFSSLHRNSVISIFKSFTKSHKKSANPNDTKIDNKFTITDHSIKRRLRSLYPIGGKINEQVFNRQCKKLEKTIQIARHNKSEIVFILPPTLLGEQPAYIMTIAYLKQLNKNYGIEYYDFSYVLQQKDFFSDADHMNVKGIEFFTKKYLQNL